MTTKVLIGELDARWSSSGGSKTAYYKVSLPGKVQLLSSHHTTSIDHPKVSDSSQKSGSTQ